MLAKNVASEQEKFEKKFAYVMVEAMTWVEKNNPGDGNPFRDENPYHNTKHMKEVARIALYIYSRETKSATLGDQMALFLAAIFHDYNHSGGEHADNVNIDMAVSGVKVFLDLHQLMPLYETVASAIQCTQYPYIKAPESLLEQCLRDADVLYPAMTKDPTVIMEGLITEMNYTRSLASPPLPPLGKKEAYAMQKNFSPEIFTKTGKEFWEVVKPAYLMLIREHYGLSDED